MQGNKYLGIKLILCYTTVDVIWIQPEIIQRQWRMQGSPDGGGAHLKSGKRQPDILVNVLQKQHETNKFGPRPRPRPPPPPFPDPSKKEAQFNLLNSVYIYKMTETHDHLTKTIKT